MRWPIALLLTGCVFEPPASVGGPPADASTPDRKPIIDAGTVVDAAPSDAQVDAGTPDSGDPGDTGVDDLGGVDAADAGAPDADADAGPPDTGDAGVVDAGNFVVPHFSSGTDGRGTGDLTLASQTINTTNMTLGVVLPTGVSFDVVTASPPGSGELAVLRVRSVSVVNGATVRVRGDRPFVILAGGDVRVNGVIDASANGTTTGPGGFGSGSGPGAGSAGAFLSPWADSGGGGGGHGTEGGRGGFAENGSAPGGAGGLEVGDPTIPILVGGSGGGRGSGGSCGSFPGGSGGGAVQIYSDALIEIGPQGAIDAGGSGGGAGPGCINNSGGGSGGGAGGAIFLMAPTVQSQGTLAANGGGGGGGASSGFNGESGNDAELGTNQASPGGSTGSFGEPGGEGGALGNPPGNGVDSTGTNSQGGNAGGGGGSVGRIRILSQNPFSDQGTSSPAPASDLY